MLEIVRVLVIEWKPAIGVVALLEAVGLNSQERIDKTRAGWLLVGRIEQCAVNFSMGVQACSQINNSGCCCAGQ